MNVALLLLPDFLLICAGAALKRTRGFDTAFWPGLERLVYFILFPALLFRSLARSPLSLASAGPLVSVALAYTLAGMALSALARPLFHMPRPVFAACFQCGFRFNTYLALAITSRLAGERGLAAVSLLVGVLVPVVNVAAVAMLAERRSAIVREIARNPLVLSCVAGIAWHITGWPLPDTADHLLSLLAGASLPLGLIAVGAGLVFGAGHLAPGPLAWWATLKLGVLPAIAFAVGRALALPVAELQAAVVLAAVPTAPSAYILAMQMTGMGAPVALLISTGTMIAAITLPLWVAALTGGALP